MPNDQFIVLDFADIGDYDALQRSLYEAGDRHVFDPDGNVIKREPPLVKTALKNGGAAILYDDNDASLFLAATFAYEAGKKRLREHDLHMPSLAEIGSSLSRRKGLGRLTVEAVTVAQYLAHGHEHVMVAAIQPGNEKSRRFDAASSQPRGAYAHFEKIIDADYASKLFEVTRDLPPPPGAKDWHVFTQNTLARHVLNLLHVRDHGLQTPEGSLRVAFSKTAQRLLPLAELQRIARQTPVVAPAALRLVS